MYHKIINPKTNRKVSIYSKLGKKIIKNYLNILNQSDFNKIGGKKKKSKSSSRKSKRKRFNKGNDRRGIDPIQKNLQSTSTISDDSPRGLNLQGEENNNHYKTENIHSFDGKTN